MIRKKFPYEGRTRQGDRARITRTALLEIRMTLQKQCETILLLQSVFLKMSESEHSDSEFYYPGVNNLWCQYTSLAYQMNCLKSLAL